MGGTVQVSAARSLKNIPTTRKAPHTGSLADYLSPTASDVPSFKLLHLESPSRLTPLGVKGLGEGGAISPPAAIANAVCDALSPFGVEFNATPIKPEGIFRAVRGAAPSTPRAA
jgi:carbon-monoxide dehydrogenase large subunit